MVNTTNNNNNSTNISNASSALERRVKARAALLGMNISDLSRLSGVSAQSFYYWFSGNITDKCRQTICDALWVDSEWIDSKKATDVGDGLDGMLEL